MIAVIVCHHHIPDPAKIQSELQFLRIEVRIQVKKQDVIHDRAEPCPDILPAQKRRFAAGLTLAEYRRPSFGRRRSDPLYLHLHLFLPFDLYLQAQLPAFGTEPAKIHCPAVAGPLALISAVRAEFSGIYGSAGACPADLCRCSRRCRCGRRLSSRSFLYGNRSRMLSLSFFSCIAENKTYAPLNILVSGKLSRNNDITYLTHPKENPYKPLFIRLTH